MRRLLLLALLAMLPGAAGDPPAEGEADPFCVVTIEPLAGFQLVRITVDEDEGDRDADFAAADADGNGVLSAAEQEAWRLSSLHLWQGGEGMGNRSLSLQPEAPLARFTPIRPVYAVTWRHVGHGPYASSQSPHTGLQDGAPVDRSQFETQAVREYAFQVVGEPASRMTLRGGTNLTGLAAETSVTQRAQPETVIVRAPPGWVVRRVEGIGYGGEPFQHTGSEAHVEIRAFDTSSPWEIDYLNPDLDEELRGSPSLMAWAVVCAVLVAALAARRRPSP